MKQFMALMFFLLIIVLGGCDESADRGGKKEVLISQGFVDDNTYRVVCRGYPLEGARGVQWTESAKRAALLGAYFYIGQKFNDAVAPDRDGKTERIEYTGDNAVLTYLVKKRGLKHMVRTAPREAVKKTETGTGGPAGPAQPDADAGGQQNKPGD